MAELALITGGTSGIGAAYARRLANDGYDLVLVARDEARLEAMATEITSASGRRVETLAADLSIADGRNAVADRLRSADSPVDYLVNNAGFGMKGGFVETPLEEHDRLLAVNVQAVIHLAHAALEVMVPRGHGKIVNISSTAALVPGFRKGSTYAASKAFVTALSEGLSVTTEGTGVTVTAVLPGFVKTEFHRRAGIGDLSLPGPLLQKPEFVVDASIKAARHGQSAVVVGAPYKAMAMGVRLIPTRLVRRVTKIIGRKNHK